MNVLSCDGGSAKIYVQLKLLQLMLAQGMDVVHKFDLCVGVSAGAIVAATLAFGKIKSVKDIDDLLSINSDVFGPRNARAPLFEPIFSHDHKRSALVSLFGESTLMRDAQVPLAVLTTMVANGHPRVITSWGNGDVRLVDALDASSAAPIFFPPVHVPSVGWLCDGGTSANIPVQHAYLCANLSLSEGRAK